MKSVLLTGADGFIGKHTIQFLLDRGFKVHAVFHNNLQSELKNDNLSWHNCNLLEPSEQKKLFSETTVTHLLHFAWYAIPGKYWNSLENLRWVQASLELFSNFIKNGGRRAVFAGTCAEYDWNYGYCSEGLTPLNPATLYGACKSSLQEMLQHSSKLTGVSSAWGRIFSLYGPYEHADRLIPSVINSLTMGQAAHCSSGYQIRDYMYAGDVSQAFAALLDSEIQGTINIASGHPIALKDLIYKVADLLNRRDLIQFDSIPAASNDARFLVANTRRLNSELGFYPNYSLDEGLQLTIKWWQKNTTLSRRR